jgi:hypothetical protein
MTFFFLLNNDNTLFWERKDTNFFILPNLLIKNLDTNRYIGHF